MAVHSSAEDLYEAALECYCHPGGRKGGICSEELHPGEHLYLYSILKPCIAVRAYVSLPAKEDSTLQNYCGVSM